jgi:filamentous hemagglutinin family protein
MRYLRSPILASYLATLMGLAPMSALANPQGGQVAGGQATIAGQGTSHVTVNQGSQRAIINWNTFNIGAGEKTQFVQPGIDAIALNRVTGPAAPSTILGTIEANGRVFLVNRDGILFGSSAVINTSGFLATTHDITNADFMAGKTNFTIPGNPSASIVNLGTITANNAGIAALVAPGVRNSGTITAELGKVALASNNGFTLDFYGDKLITMQVDGVVANQVKDVQTGQTLDALVKNEGPNAKLSANGGRVELTAAAARHVVDSVINNSGVIEANSVGTRNGKIVLGAATASTKGAVADVQKVKVSGTLSAAGKKSGEKGGKIHVTGEEIALRGAKLDASGAAGGGAVLVGGDVGGGKGNKAVASLPQAALEGEAIATASTVTVDAGTLIDVSAAERGNGGKAVIWSDHLTSFAGAIQARGGAYGGDGGFAEVSSKGQLSYMGLGDLRAPAGKFGTLLLDPTDLYLNNTGVAPANDGSSAIAIWWIVQQLALSNVVLTTAAAGAQEGNIHVVNNISWSGSTSLTLGAHNNIYIGPGATITNTGGGSLILAAGVSYSGTGPWTTTGHGTVVFQGTGPQINWANSYGNVYFAYNPSGGYANPTNYGDNVATNANWNAYVAGGPQFQPYMWVNDLGDLRNVSQNLAGYYVFSQIDASATAVTGFTPIGTRAHPFTGRFVGLDAFSVGGIGGTIDGLHISSSAERVGLFGFIGDDGFINGVHLTNVDISLTGAGSTQYAGALAGWNDGRIINSSASGRLGNTSSPQASVQGGFGGLVGYNNDDALIQGSSADVHVTVHGPASGWIDAGGLVGANAGVISASYATGAVSGVSYSSLSHTYLGGLVGWNRGEGSRIEMSYASGAVNGTGAFGDAGGLVGVNAGQIAWAYALGSVSVSGSYSSAGGLIGRNSGSVEEAYATGAVSKSGNGSVAGGFVGTNSGGFIAKSFWDVQTSGQSIGAGSGSTSGMTGLVTSEALWQSAYAGSGGEYMPGWAWDFGSQGKWFMVDGFTRPFLRAEWSATIKNTHQLQLMAMDLGANYTLANHIFFGDAFSNGSDMWGGAAGQGFAPIGGNGYAGFSGSFDGGGHSIAGLKFAPTASWVDEIGLFGVIGASGKVANVNLTDALVVANPNLSEQEGDSIYTQRQYLGLLAGMNYGFISNVLVHGRIEGGDVRRVTAGGLVGANMVEYSDNPELPSGGSIVNAHADVDVTIGSGTDCGVECSAWNYAGGLAGRSFGTISQSTASGDVVAGNNAFAGGLVAYNNGDLTGVAAGGDVSAGNGSSVGGLVGHQGSGGTITGGVAGGNVSGGASSLVGGLAGANYGAIIGGLAIGDVVAGASSEVGGLVGYNSGDGSLAVVKATGNVSSTGAGSKVGGLVGRNDGLISGAEYVAASGKGVYGTSDSAIGGLVGLNDGMITNFFVDPPVVGSGTNNSVGGAVGENSGTLQDGTVVAAVSGGSGSAVGLVTGVNSGSVSGVSSSGTVNGVDPNATPNNPDNPPPNNPPSDNPPPSNPPTNDPPPINPTQYTPPPDPNRNTFVLQTSDPTPSQGQSGSGGQGGSAGGQGGGQGGQGGGNGGTGNNNPPPPQSGPPPGPGIGRTVHEQRFSGVPPVNETRFLPGEVVVQVANTVPAERIQEIARQLGITLIASQAIDGSGRVVYRFSTGNGKNIRDVIRALERQQIVASAQPNYVFGLAQAAVQDVAPAPPPVGPAEVETGSLPPSPELSSDLQSDMASRTTGLPKGDAAQYIIDKLRLGVVHARSVGRNIPVAVIDSEIDVQHPDLVGVVSETFDATGTASNPHAHGTGMAGAIASHRRLLGIAPGVKILAVKAFDETNTSAEATSFQILKGLAWALTKKPRIINMSFAGPRDLMLERALQKAYEQGIVLIAAAGNAGPKSPPLYPAADVNVIAVSASDHADKPFAMANRGKHIAVAAPGVDVLVPSPKGGYQLTTGTSVAAAHVSGVAALLLESKPTLTPKEVRAILTGSARPIALRGVAEIFGAGLIDPFEALSRLGPRPVSAAPAASAVQ